MKSSTLILIFVLTLLASIILPFSFRVASESINQTLNLTATIISSISAILTFIIAIILYNKYGIETSLLEKNTTVVFSFLEELKLTRFFISGEKYGMQIQMHDPHFPTNEQFYSDKLVFAWEYYEGLDKLFAISSSPFMPKTIADKVQKMRFWVLALDVPEDDLKNYSKVTLAGQYKVDAKYGRFNHEDMTLFEFLNILEDVKNETTNWIKKNSTYAPDLNL